MKSDEQAHDTNLRALDQALTESIGLRKRLNALGRADLVAVLNVAQFAILFNFDLSCLLRDTELHRGSWRAKLYSRFLVLLVFECVNDMTTLLGGGFRQCVVDLSPTDSSTDVLMLNQLHKELSDFRRTHDVRLREIRKAVVAHRHHDAEEQIRYLQMLPVREVLELGLQIMDWLNRLYDFLGALLSNAMPDRRAAKS